MRNTNKNCPNGDEKTFRCPNCNELLEPIDLEAFNRCSFCDQKFEDSYNLEEFVLSPVVQNWISSCNNNFPQD